LARLRVYSGRDGNTIIILLGGGSKRRQSADITAAIERWKRYKQAKNLHGTDREYKATVVARIKRDPQFAQALYSEAINALLEGETDEGSPNCAILFMRASPSKSCPVRPALVKKRCIAC